MNKIQAMVFAAIAGFALFAAIGVAVAAQPKEDSIVLDKDGCNVEVRWVDGLEVASKVTISFDGVVKQTITLDDIVGDQSAVLASVSGSEGTSIRARLYVGNELADEATTTITRCPTATPSPTATNTPAATSTPAPTVTPVPPVPTPIVIVQTVEVPKIVTVISPPNTGDGGLR